MLDLDGTIYQTLDLKEGAWHATKANGRSVGIEIANIGAYRRRNRTRGSPAAGTPRTRRQDPARPSPDPELVPHPRPRHGPPTQPRRAGHRHRPGPGLAQYDLTPQQYDALIKLTATLCKVFPKISCDYPRDAEGQLIPRKLPDDD